MDKHYTSKKKKFVCGGHGPITPPLDPPLHVVHHGLTCQFFNYGSVTKFFKLWFGTKFQSSKPQNASYFSVLTRVRVHASGSTRTWFSPGSRKNRRVQPVLSGPFAGRSRELKKPHALSASIKRQTFLRNHIP